MNVMDKENIAVIGGGTIGADVALDCAINNYYVQLKDLSDNMLERATKKIKDSYRFTKLMKKNGKLNDMCKKYNGLDNFRRLYDAQLCTTFEQFRKFMFV